MSIAFSAFFMQFVLPGVRQFHSNFLIELVQLRNLAYFAIKSAYGESGATVSPATTSGSVVGSRSAVAVTPSFSVFTLTLNYITRTIIRTSTIRG